MEKSFFYSIVDWFGLTYRRLLKIIRNINFNLEALLWEYQYKTYLILIIYLKLKKKLYFLTLLSVFENKIGVIRKNNT